MAVHNQSSFRSELARRRRPFALIPTIATLASACGAAFVIIVAGYMLVPNARHGSTLRYDPSSVANLSIAIAAYAAIALVLLRRLPRIALVSLRDIGLAMPTVSGLYLLVSYGRSCWR